LGVSGESARAKIRRLGLVEVEQRKNACSSSSELIMPEELISIEDALKKLVAAMTALETHSSLVDCHFNVSFSFYRDLWLRICGNNI